MPAFDPTLPATDSDLKSVEIRNNLNALKELIDAVPPGQVGPAGPAGRDGTDGGVGPAGPAGRDGIDGGQGPQGEQGPPGNDGRALVGVVDNGLGQVELQMSDGTNYGPFTVASGPQGIQGPQGPMGEVSAQQLADAIGTTSANTNSVATLGLTVSDPPTQYEMQTIANKLDELIAALRR